MIKLNELLLQDRSGFIRTIKNAVVRPLKDGGVEVFEKKLGRVRVETVLRGPGKPIYLM